MTEQLQRARQLYENGRFDEAAEACRAILTRDARDGEANHLLGLIYYRRGQNREALTLLQRAVASGGATGRMYSNLGALLNSMGDIEQAIAAYRRAIDIDRGNPWPLNNLGVLYRQSGQLEAAAQCFKQALALKPDLAEARTNLRLVYASIVPQWHFAMMNDHRRNDAYEAAIRRAVGGKHVLEIGTGAGLLALIAADAGAASVDTCEAVDLVARQAAAIVAKTPQADRIRVHAKRSTDLIVGRDIAQRAEILITETFSSNLLDEGIIPSLEHAHRRLLAGNAVTIPAAASAIGFLIGGSVIGEMLFAGSIKGFDFSAFNEFAPPRLVVPLDGISHEALSDDVELLRFDLSRKEFPMEGREVALPVQRSGICFGVGQWIRLDLDSQTKYSNRPVAGGQNTHWPNIIYRFPQPLEVTAGCVVRVIAQHDRAEINVDLIP